MSVFYVLIINSFVIKHLERKKRASIIYAFSRLTCLVRVFVIYKGRSSIKDDKHSRGGEEWGINKNFENRTASYFEAPNYLQQRHSLNWHYTMGCFERSVLRFPPIFIECITFKQGKRTLLSIKISEAKLTTAGLTGLDLTLRGNL